MTRLLRDGVDLFRLLLCGDGGAAADLGGEPVAHVHRGRRRRPWDHPSAERLLLLVGGRVRSGQSAPESVLHLRLSPLKRHHCCFH